MSTSTEAIDRLFKHVIETGSQEVTEEKNEFREEEGRFSNLHRRLISTLCVGNLKIVALQDNWLSSKPAGDAHGTSLELTVTEKDQQLFHASREAEQKVKRFGYQERFEGNETIPERSWRATGDLPEELLNIQV
jgi:hypothetical protein